MKLPSLFLVSIVAAWSLTACLPGSNWLLGKWELDREKTEAAMGSGEAPAGGENSLLGGIANRIGSAVSGAILGQLESMTIVFTADEMRRIAKDGSGKSIGYKIIERPDGNTVVIQDADGDISTFHREGKHIWQGLDEEGKLRVYLKPAAAK